MSDPLTDKLPKTVEELCSVSANELYNPRFASVKSLSSLILQLEIKYLGFAQEYAEELRLAEENIADLQQNYAPEIITQALKILTESKGNPEYFNQHQVDHAIQMPIAIANNIITKKEEAELKQWKSEHMGRMIARLKSIRRRKSVRYFIAGLFGK